MPDTGVLNFQTQTGAWDTSTPGFGATGTVLSDDGNYSAALSGTTSCVIDDSSGTDVPSGATITGMEVFATDTGYLSSFAAASLKVEVSINNGTSYGSTSLTEALTSSSTLTPTTDITFGSSSQLWGITWPSTGFDVSLLNIKLTNIRTGFGLSHFDHISAKIHYIAGVTADSLSTINGSLKIKNGGKVQIINGKLLIN
tara:strand:- start:697 stop:1293 length:597 start_codon:yes stop_codon:yes gene_type:complete